MRSPEADKSTETMLRQILNAVTTNKKRRKLDLPAKRVRLDRNLKKTTH